MAKKLAPNPILCLPFVRANRTGGGFKYWCPEVTGHLSVDRDIGQSYAVAFMEWIQHRPSWHCDLAAITEDMAKCRASDWAVRCAFLKALESAIHIGARGAITLMVSERDLTARLSVRNLLEGASI